MIPQSFFPHTIYGSWCFVHDILITNQATLEKNPVTNESAAFSFSVNCSFNNTLSHFELQFNKFLKQRNYGKAVTHLSSWSFKTFTLDLMLA